MGPCNWPVSYAACSDTAALDSLDVDTRAAVEQSAVEYLWRWTNQAFGTCPTTIRPCRAGCAEPTTFEGGHMLPLSRSQPVAISFRGDGPDNLPTYSANWVDYSCGSCEVGRCTCENPARDLVLPGPISSLTEVRIDGEILPLESFRVDNRRYVVRQDGGVWPICQDLSLPLTEQGTWAVTYERGNEVPSGGKIAAGLLAAEIAKSICDDGDCQLPGTVQSVTRQGVTMVMLDLDTLDKGVTGIWLVDSWVASIVKPPRRSRVYSPDIPRTRYRKRTS